MNTKPRKRYISEMAGSLPWVGGSAWRGVDRAGKWACSCVADGRLSADRGCDGGREFLAVAWVRDAAAFAGMAEVAAFDEYAWDCWISGEADSAAYEAAAGIASRACARHRLLQAGGEAVAIDAPVIRLGATAV